MAIIDELVKEIKNICIVGHIKPDGDCIGSCLGLYDYIVSNNPNVNVTVRLESVPSKYMFLTGADKIVTDASDDMVYDLFIGLDSSTTDRYGHNEKFYKSAKKTFIIDHHVSNSGFGDGLILEPNASSASEVLFNLLDEDKISDECAKALYVGIISDTGVFRYSCTTCDTMIIASKLMAHGFDFADIVSKCYMEKTYMQSQIMGKALLQSIRFLNGKCIASVVTRADMELFDVNAEDLDGIIDQMKLVKGVDCAILVYEESYMKYKASMRSNEFVDVSKIAVEFGGGGHKKAAGFNLTGTGYDVVNNIVVRVENQLKEHGRC